MIPVPTMSNVAACSTAQDAFHSLGGKMEHVRSCSGLQLNYQIYIKAAAFICVDQDMCWPVLASMCMTIWSIGLGCVPG